MLGENIIPDERGRVVGTRVLPDGKIEFTFQTSGKILDVEFNNTGTIVNSPRPGGLLFGEGQGVAMTKDGEIITWTAQGIGKPTGRGLASSFRESVYLQTQSERLARINSVAVVVEAEFDENGNVQAKLWEWK